MQEVDSGRFRLDVSRFFFIFALAALSGYAVTMAMTGVASPFVIVSGNSMEPTYHAGDLLVLKSVSPASISEGEIVVFHTPRNGVDAGLPPRVAHRVVEIQPVTGLLGFQTKGDNSDLDGFVVRSDLIIGSVWTNLGPVGKPLALISNIRLLLMIGMPLAVAGGVIWLLARQDDDEDDFSENDGKASQSRATPRPDVGPDQADRLPVGFVTSHDQRQADRAVARVNRFMLSNRVSPQVRKAFDDVTERLTEFRSNITARRSEE